MNADVVLINTAVFTITTVLSSTLQRLRDHRMRHGFFLLPLPPADEGGLSLFRIWRTISKYETERKELESRACCSAVTEQILWSALTIAKEKEIETEKANVKVGVEKSEKTKAAHVDSLDEWLKSGIPVIKWGRNNKPYPRLVRVSTDGKCLEWVPMNKSRWVASTHSARTFPLQDIKSINTSEGGKHSDDVVYSVHVGLPERLVRMDLSSPQGFAWFEALKARGLNIN